MLFTFRGHCQHNYKDGDGHYHHHNQEDNLTYNMHL